ncbi:MAG: hypothetical protein AAB483_03100 [Patescibacteria group bacterium]
MRKKVFVLVALLVGGCAEGPAGPKIEPTPTPPPSLITAECVANTPKPTTAPGMTVGLCPPKDQYAQGERVGIVIKSSGLKGVYANLFYAWQEGDSLYVIPLYGLVGVTLTDDWVGAETALSPQNKEVPNRIATIADLGKAKGTVRGDSKPFTVK